MASMEKRLQKELQALLKDPPAGVNVDINKITSNLAEWVVDVAGASGTLYEGETFKLQFKFGSRYPFDSPEVIFLGPNIPIHPHVYSNGHICLSILTEDWSPALSVQSVCLSIVSMLSSCKEKKRPVDNSFYVKTCNENPKKTRWWYHDDTGEMASSFTACGIEAWSIIHNTFRQESLIQSSYLHDAVHKHGDMLRVIQFF